MSLETSSSLFEYDCEAVRVRAKRFSKTGEEELRKFSVDPNLTSFDILKSILSRAFDVDGAGEDFIIYFMSGGEWLPLLSDWDLDVAIIGASEPCLNLVITERNSKKFSLDEEKLKEQKPAAETCPQVSTESETSSNSDMLNSLRYQFEKKFVPSLTNRFQKALTLAEDTIGPKGQQFLSMIDGANGSAEHQDLKPLSEKEFKTFLNKVGEVVRPRELRLAVYQAGIEPQLRKVVWKHLLGVYPTGMTGRQRVDFIKERVLEYESLKQSWMEMMLQGRVTDDLKYITTMVKKDVLRTDRQLGYFSGEGNTNINILYNILTTFALNHPSVGYCQGMSDLLSPILVVMTDEGQAYLCFCALMARLKSNFFSDGKTMTRKFEHLSQGLLYYDPEFYAYLKLHRADDLLYCYRWLLLELKREFSFEDACVAIEVIWASLPPPSNPLKGSQGGVILFEQRFGRKNQLPGSFIKRDNSAFTNVVTVRKRLSSSEESPKRGVMALRREHQNRGRIHSAGAADDEDQSQSKGKPKKTLKKSKSLFGPPVKTSNSASNLTNQPETAEEDEKPVKKITDLNEFYRMAAEPDSKGDDEEFEDLSNEAGIDYWMGSKSVAIPLNRLPPPAVFGDGNPFLMFMCISCILQHRDYIIEQQLDYQEIAMYFDRMVRRHNVKNTLRLARKMFAEYLNDDWKRDNNAHPMPSKAC